MQRQPEVRSQFCQEIYRWTRQEESEEDWRTEELDESAQQQGGKNGEQNYLKNHSTLIDKI